jgi:hypothetical protein
MSSETALWRSGLLKFDLLVPDAVQREAMHR